ncbi:MAG: TnpV protein [Clostridia bacterium]
MNKITYHKEGDYLIPDLIMENSNKDYRIGKYGRLRLNYLKEHKRGLYTELIISGELSNHLASINSEADKRVSDIIRKLAEAEGIDESLKQTNQMQWVQVMNNIKNRAEEIVYNEIIYV